MPEKRLPPTAAVLVRVYNLRKGDNTSEGEVLEVPTKGDTEGWVKVKFSGNRYGVKPSHGDWHGTNTIMVYVDGDRSNLPVKPKGEGEA